MCVISPIHIHLYFLFIDITASTFFIFYLKLITYMWSHGGIWHASANRSGFKGAGQLIARPTQGIRKNRNRNSASKQCE